MWSISQIIAAFLSIRVLLLIVRIGLLSISPRNSDFLHFFLLARQVDQGLLPVVHYWVEYPPLFPWLSTGLYLISSTIADGRGVDLPYYAIVGLVLVAADAVVFVLIYRLSCLLWKPPAPRYSLLLYGLLFVPYYLWSGSFDALPAALLLIGLWLLLTGHMRVSAVAAALGFCTKLFPIVLLPIAFCVIAGWRNRITYLAIFVLTSAAVLAPFFLISREMMLVSLQAMWSRRPWETVWALAQGFYGPGYVGPVSARTDAAFWAAPAQPGAGDLWIAILFATVFVVFCRNFWKTTDRHRIVAGVSFALCLLFLYSKGYSPQYLIWLAPLIAVLLPNRIGAFYLAILGIANLIEAPLYFGFFPEQRELLRVAVVIRTLCLSVLALHTLYISIDIGSRTRTASLSLERLPD